MERQAKGPLLEFRDAYGVHPCVLRGMTHACNGCLEQLLRKQEQRCVLGLEGERQAVGLEAIKKTQGRTFRNHYKLSLIHI